MKRIIFALCVIMLAFCKMAAVSAEAPLKEFKREVTKEFSVSSNPNLNIDNKFGQIRIIEGADNKISFNIEIIGKGITEALAKEYAEAVSIDFSQSGDNVSATTMHKNMQCNNCGRETNYTVIAPKGVMMKLVNKFGNITLDKSIKPLNVDLEYGNLVANTLTDVTINVKFGQVTINACENINFESAYTKIKIGKANQIKAKSEFDDFQLGTVADVVMKTQYTPVKIDQLNKSFICDNFKFCSLDIANISPQFSQIKIDAGYSQIKLALDNRHSFKADLRTRYGNINSGNFAFNIKSDRNTQTCSGTFGSASNPLAIVDISTEFGDIVFK